MLCRKHFFSKQKFLPNIFLQNLLTSQFWVYQYVDFQYQISIPN